MTDPPDPPSAYELSPFALGKEVEDRLGRVLRSEIARYPSGSLGVASMVTIGSKLTRNGQCVGAVHFFGVILIAAGEHDAGASTDAHVARAFHHEVSHALMGAHGTKFDAALFRAALPPGFVYADDRPGVVDGGPLGPEEDSPSLDLLDEGFLVPWGKRRMDEDFASYAEVLLRKPELLLATFAPESRVGRKARVVRDFYLAIDPGFGAIFAPPHPEPPSSPPPPGDRPPP
jgi:hypothetical protein